MLAPKVREFLSERAFGQKVELNTPEMVKAISSNVVGFVTIASFVKALRKLVVEDRKPELISAGRLLSTVAGFPWSRPTVPAKKCIFNLVPCLNKLEESFAKFLEKADDVVRFSKLPERFGFVIEYTDSMGNLRHYESDFVVVDAGGVHYVVETKGQEDVNVEHKDRAATLWAENATALTGTP